MLIGNVYEVDRRRIRVLHITFSLDRGGLERLVFALLTKLTRTRFQPIVCTLQREGALEGLFEAAGIPVHVVEKKEGVDPFLVIKLARLFQRERIDLVHTHNASPWLYGVLATALSGCGRVIHTEHSNIEVTQRLMMRVSPYLSKRTSAIAAVSTEVARCMIDRQRIDPKNVHVVFNGVDVEKYKANQEKAVANKHDLNIPDDCSVVGIVARLVPVKDHMTLLRAFQSVVEQMKNVKLLIIGDGECREEMVCLCDALKLTDHVQFLGARDDIQDLLPLFDLFVLSSLSEGLSIALLEAMATGTPVVATKVGGNCDAVADGVTGLLVESQNPKALALAMLRILQDRSFAKEMGSRGRQRVLDHFSLESMTNQYEALYQSALAPRKGA